MVSRNIMKKERFHSPQTIKEINSNVLYRLQVVVTLVGKCVVRLATYWLYVDDISLSFLHFLSLEDCY